jgi:hypothetical protein
MSEEGRRGSRSRGTPVPQVTEKRLALSLNNVRIVWDQQEYQRVGKVGGIPLFFLAYRSSSSHQKYQLTCALPGYNSRDRVWRHDDQSWLESKAAQLMVSWLTQITKEG